MIQSRWKSTTTWTSLAILVLFVLKNYFDIEIDKADELINLLMTALIGFGILNNPTRSDKF